MVIFSPDSLNLIPTNALTSLVNAMTVDREEKNVELGATNAKMSKLQGTSTLRTPTQGRISVSNGGTPAAREQQEAMLEPANNVANGAALLNSSGTNPSGAPVFVPGTVPTGTTSEQVDTMNSEINDYFSSQVKVALGVLVVQKLSALQQKSSNLQVEVDELTNTIDTATEILEKRATGELPNPQLNIQALDTQSLPPSIAQKVEVAAAANEKYIQSQVIAPYIENQKLIQTLTAQASGVFEDVQPVFDLDFGPPISTNERFVLSKDGLYYDSRSGDVPDVIPYPVSADMWNLQYPSNRGGRGLSFTEEDGESTVNTIFDLNVPYQEENPRVEAFQLYDDVLQQFEDDKQSHMTQVSGYIAEILANGYGATDAIVQSYTAQLGAVASVYDSKIRKRKRQLTIAAIFGRDSFIVTNRQHPLGEGLFFQYEPPTGKAFEYKLQYKDLPDAIKTINLYQLDGGQTVAYNTKTKKVVDEVESPNILAKVGFWKEIPRIPINDFSYLKQSDIPLQTQKQLTLFSEDLDTIIAPYQAKYVIGPTDMPPTSVDSLAVDPIGFGDWVHRETSGSLSATTPLYKSLTDDIISEDLLVCYNFLDPDAVTEPSGTLYALNNAAEGSNRLDGKLVGYDKSFVFPSGVGQAYFGGTIFDERGQRSALWADVKGSYVRLPNSTKDYNVLQPNIPYNGARPLDNLFYSKEGVTIDFWAYVPRVYRDMTDEHRYRLVFANENSGPAQTDYLTATTQSNASPGKGLTPGGTNFNRTIGMIMGWRDRGSPAPAGTNTSGLEFCIAPTVGQNQSYDTTPTTTWGHSVCIAETWATSAGNTPSAVEVKQVGMYIPSSVLNSSGTGIQDVSSGYHHISVSFDYVNEDVNFHLDGELLTTSSLSDVLGGNPDDTTLPTSVKMDLDDKSDLIFFNDPTVESFLGNTIYDERCTPERVAFPVFTPWIIGGGYTDNIPKIPGTDYKPQGFLGSNTNNTHQGTVRGDTLITTTIGGELYPVGQHDPPLSAPKGGGSPTRIIPRSGLDGYIGSFKIYTRALTTTEAKHNYTSQKGFFKNILLPS
tara:strand:+ start:4179 stop:7349 length:3171 start_codon:yes stop_codon:yes gene_type:complete